MRDGNSGGATGDAWLVWGFLGFLFILATFHRSSMSVLADRLMADLGASAASFGAITSAYFYVYMLMQVPSGALADTLGPRLLVAGGLAISAAGCFLLSAAGSVPTALAGRLLIGLGVSGIFVSTLKVQAERFPPSTFATLSGLATVMGNIGNLAATVPFAVVVNAVGWRRPFVAIGLLSAFCAVAAWLVLRPKRVNGPTGSGGTGDRPPVRKALAAVLRNPATWPPLLANFGLYGTYLAFTSMWGVPYLMTTYGLPRAAAAARLVYGIAGFALGGPALGLLSDRVFRRRRAVYAGVALFTLATWSIIALGGARPPLRAWGPLLFAMGFGYGSMTLALANIKEVN
ncbi:MAG: MFS transporter, partial [Clostridia bacterium]|nr:MFS transporter [Clostridia bacterium]